MAAHERSHDLIHSPCGRLAKTPSAAVPLRERGELADAVGGLLDGAEAARGMHGEGAAGFGGYHATTGAHEEVGAEGLLELADLLRDRGCETRRTSAAP